VARSDRPVAPVDEELFNALYRVNRNLSEDELQMLARAILSGGPVRITYRSSSGSVTDRVISQIEFFGHLVEAWCHLRSDSRNFLVSEIQSVTRA
jgi:predicted DNA-binding transcriptional regulator YafY